MLVYAFTTINGYADIHGYYSKLRGGYVDEYLISRGCFIDSIGRIAVDSTSMKDRRNYSDMMNV